MKLSVTGTAAEPVIGLLDPSLEGTELLNCPLHLPKLNEIAHFIKEKIISEKLHPYEPKRRLGELKGLIMMSNKSCSEIIVRFVLRSRDLQKRIERVSGELQNNFPRVKVVSINLQPVHHAILEGEEEILLSDDTIIWEELNGIAIAYGPQSFMQVTPEITEKLYYEAQRILSHYNVREVTELFCGSGGFLLTCAGAGISGIGLELSHDAVLCAQKAAVKNGITNVSFITADLSKELQPGTISREAVIVNPPRRGIGGAVCKMILESRPKYILYSSCNPNSLCEDLKALSKAYKIDSITPFDMFPMTNHLEVLCLLENI